MTARPTPLPGPVVVTLFPVTDWHIGAGHGIPGEVDAVVRRDPDGLPYVPGTTLTGLLRDACATVAHALDDGADTGPWQDWHTYAFGDAHTEVTARRHGPVPATVGIGPARLAAGLRREILADRALVGATTTVRVGVAIDEATGRALDKALRFVEYARGGLPLTAELTLPAGLDGDQATAASALLVLGTAWCDRMGGDRRRGPGEVRAAVAGASATEWAAWLDSSGWRPPAVPGRAAVTGAPVALPDDGGWTAVDLTITTTGPLRVPAATTGNVVRGHDFLPGAALLPWLSDRWGADTVAAAVAGGAVVVRHAHPEVDGRRGLPVPLTVFRGKTGGEQVSVGEPGDGHRQVRDRWTVADPAGALPLQVRSTAQVSHNTVDRARQRPDGPAGVHELEVIPAGRVLRSTVLLAPALVERLVAEHGPDWVRPLAGPARLGSRRRGEYGGCLVAATGPSARPDVAPPSGGFSLWLGSDAVVLDPGLRPGADPDDLRRALAGQLRVEGLALASVAARTRRCDGWQGRWGLPRESQVGLAAGSVVKVTLPPGAVVDPEGWWRLVHLGVGERTVEGFGEVVVDAPMLTRDTAAVIDRVPATQRAADLDDSGDDHGLPLELLRTVVRRETIRSAVAGHRDAGPVVALRTALAGLSDSQRGTWRAVTAAAAVARDPDRVLGHADGWQRNKQPRRREQRAVAQHVTSLLTAGLDEALGIGLDDPGDRAFALAALVADLLDTLPEVAR